MNYYYPEIGSQSKATWVLDAMSAVDSKSNIIRDKTVDTCGGVFWGLGRNNAELIKQHQNSNTFFYFTDMPYWNRWLGNNRDTCSWRVIPNALHCNWEGNYPDDRFKQLNIHLHDWRKTGNHILVCPSSHSINMFYNQERWLSETLAQLALYTDRPIKVRNKPRNNKTSGPLAATVPFDEDIKDAWAIVTTVSIAGVEAACKGIPVFCSRFSPCAPIGNLNLSSIENPVICDRSRWVNTLAYHQYTEQELRAGNFRILK